ncbi:hypothetical protein [Clostridium sp. ZBS17]|uniref:hypothetical protein n=1 Tax=Clostridium sp. ZBS17 TaxID=2949968 RepID=UPI002079ED8E|nr:hypothetical protein [Clostridium sp. ZBS17]
MIQELQTERLDINNHYNVDIICKQLDDVMLKIIVYDKSVPADLGNYTCRLKAFKADQVSLIQNTNITIKENIVTIKADKQLTTTNGIVKAELQFINKTTLEKKSTFYINIEVVASVLDVEGTVSTPTCTILEEIDHKLDQIENIGEVLDEAKEVRDTLTNKTIPTATSINSKLETNIGNASTKITEVESIISSASIKIEEVETCINNADFSKKELDLSKTNADISKENLDAANTLAEKNIEELNSLGNVTDLAKNVQTNTTDIANLKENVENNTSYLKDIAKPNLLINGDFQVWQRGTNFNVANNRFIYTSDRWCGISNFQNSTIKKDGEYIKFEINEVGNGDDFNILQGLESMNVIPLRNRKVTLSLDIKKYSNMLSGDIAINIYCGTGTDELLANTNRVAFDKVISYSELSETPKRFNLSTELPNNVSSLCVVIRCGSRYGNKPNNGASFGVKNVKLELGSVATPFIPRSYGEELVLCQRYYQRYTTKGAVYDTNNLIINEMFTVSMRTRPTVKITNDILFDINQFKEIQFTISSLNVYSTYIGNILSNENNLVKGNLYVVSIILDAEIY